MRRFLCLAVGVALVAGLAMQVMAASSSSVQDELLNGIKTKVKDPAKPFVLLVKAKTKSGEADKFIELFKEPIKESRKESGCSGYELTRDSEDSNQFYIHEKWKSVADLETHFKKDYIIKMLGAVHELLDGPPELKVAVPVGE